MISLNCTKCQAQLQIDDAFAGSACRCQFCGTIQTVPGKRRASQPAGAGTKTLYSNQARQAGSGLDALAEVVASSSGLQNQVAAEKKPAPSAPAARSALPTGLAIGIGAGVVLILVLSILLLVTLNRQTPTPRVSESAAAPSPSTPPTAPPDAASPAARSPMFADIPIPASPVVFVLDRGSSTRDSIGPLGEVTIKAIRSLGPDRKFQIVFWDNGDGPLAIPAGGPAFATEEAIGVAQRAIDGVVAFGRTDALPSVRRALAARPAVVVLATAKGFELDEGFVKSLLDARGSAGVPFHTISVGGAAGEPLEQLARQTGGQYRAMTSGELRQLTN